MVNNPDLCRFHRIDVYADTMLIVHTDPQSSRTRNLIRAACQELSCSVEDPHVPIPIRDEINAWGDLIIKAFLSRRDLSLLEEVKEVLFDILDYVNTFIEPSRSCSILRARADAHVAAQRYVSLLNKSYIRRFFAYHLGL